MGDPILTRVRGSLARPERRDRHPSHRRSRPPRPGLRGAAMSAGTVAVVGALSGATSRGESSASRALALEGAFQSLVQALARRARAGAGGARALIGRAWAAQAAGYMALGACLFIPRPWAAPAL